MVETSGIEWSGVEKSGIEMSFSHCLDRINVMHEFIHAFGFIHEHNRSDRDDFVEIHKVKLVSKELNHFAILSTSFLGTYPWSLAPADYTGAFFTSAHFQKIAHISSLCDFHYINEGISSLGLYWCIFQLCAFSKNNPHIQLMRFSLHK